MAISKMLNFAATLSLVLLSLVIVGVWLPELVHRGSVKTKKAKVLGSEGHRFLLWNVRERVFWTLQRRALMMPFTLL